MFDDVSLEDMLKEFTQGQYHIAIVRTVEQKEDSDPEYITIGNYCVGVAMTITNVYMYRQWPSHFFFPVLSVSFSLSGRCGHAGRYY